MSGMRLTVGVIAQLEKSFGDYNQPEHEDLQDHLETIGSRLKLTYGGDMIVFIQSDSREDDGPGLVLADDDIMVEFEEELRLANLFVLAGTPKMFVDNWYDGADPPHLDITLEQAGYFSEEI